MAASVVEIKVQTAWSRGWEQTSRFPRLSFRYPPSRFRETVKGKSSGNTAWYRAGGGPRSGRRFLSKSKRLSGTNVILGRHVWYTAMIKRCRKLRRQAPKESIRPLPCYKRTSMDGGNKRRTTWRAIVEASTSPYADGRALPIRDELHDLRQSSAIG